MSKPHLQQSQASFDETESHKLFAIIRGSFVYVIRVFLLNSVATNKHGIIIDI